MKDLIREKKEHGLSPFTFQAMAERCRVQKTYLSKVLNHDGHLTRDQLYLAADYLKLKAIEREFVLLLHDHETSILELRRRELNRQINELRTEHSRTEKFAKVRKIEGMGDDDFPGYYLDPNFSLIHMFLTIPKFRQQPKLIAEPLGLSAERLARYLERLESAGILAVDKGGYRVVVDNIHLAASSELQPVYRSSMRLKALEKMAHENKDNYSFSVIFSSNTKIRKQLKTKFLEYIKAAQQMIQDNPEEQVFQMNFDLVSWSPEGQGPS